ncbi:MAG: hypothetical protein PHD31_02400, partial [Candidatus Pacebacteria bacterium]|nr:hypothetical protein [Candidatus Paceibacterota bacterium]
MLNSTFIEKEKIRTMKKDIMEAEGTLIYPKEEIQSEDGQIPAFFERSFNLETPNIEEGLLVEEEKKKAEELAEEIAMSVETGKSIADNEEISMNQQKTEEQLPFNLPIEETLVNPTEEPLLEFIPIGETPETKNETEPEQPEPELGIEPVEEKIEIAEILPSAKELGLEETEEIENVSNAITESKEETTKEDDEKALRAIAEKTFEIEKSLKSISKEKAPFEKRKAEINKQIDNLRK